MAVMSSVASSDSWFALTTVIAAATYLFDAGSNTATAAKYYQFNHQGAAQVHDEIGHSIDAGGAFVVVVTLIAVAHITNLVMFCTMLESQDRPVAAAFFLPLIHLKRLTQVLGRTCSVHGFKDTTSVDAARLYNILAAALETGPQLIFQYAVLHAVGSNCSINCKLPKVLLISIIGSLISGAYNGGAAVASMLRETCKLATRLSMGIVAGIHILCALIIRSLAFSFIVTGAPTLYIVLYASSALGVPCVLFWAFTKPSGSTRSQSSLHRQGRKLLHAVANGHVSLSLGPLYPLTRDAHVRELQGYTSFHGVLTLATMAHLMLDLGGIILIYKAAFYKPSNGVDNYPPPCTAIADDVFLPCTLFLVLLSLAVSLYVVSIIAYLIIDKTIHTTQSWMFQSSSMVLPLMGMLFYQRWRLYLLRTKMPEPLAPQVNV